VPSYEAREKFEARRLNIARYREITGNQSVPDGRGYWTLCDCQSLSPSAEIAQMEKAGLLRKSQFHGVDRDPRKIARNAEFHPDANWHLGEWLDVIREAGFNPGLVYLDTTQFADHRRATEIVRKTMMLCPKQTVLFANVMLNDPRSSREFDPCGLLKNLARDTPSTELAKWDPRVMNYSYNCTGKTKMQTYVMKKHGNQA
jgi:hypothetical protein